MENFKWSLELAISLLIPGGIEPDKWQHSILDLCDVVE